MFWIENPLSHSIVCYIRIIDVQLLHSTEIARLRTIRIIETSYSSVFASLWSLFSSSHRDNRHTFELSFLEKESHKEIQHEINYLMSKTPPKKTPKSVRQQRKENQSEKNTFGEIDSHIVFGLRLKKGAGAENGCAASRTSTSFSGALNQFIKKTVQQRYISPRFSYFTLFF